MADNRLAGNDYTIHISITQKGAREAKAKIYELAEGVKQLKQSAQNSNALQKMEVGFKKITAPSKKAGEAMADFAYRLKSIVLYRFVRGLLTQISNAIKEGNKNLYEYSKQVGTDFAPAMDKLATSALYLKNAFATLFAPLASQFAQWIDVIVDKIVEVINLFSRFMALLSGKGMYSKALKHQKAYNDSLASGSKKAKDFITSIDELNVLNDNGGSGGASAENYGAMFEEEETGTWKDFLANTNFIPTILEIAKGIALVTLALKTLKAEGFTGLLGDLETLAEKAVGIILIFDGLKGAVEAVTMMIENGVSGEGIAKLLARIGEVMLGVAVFTGKLHEVFTLKFALIAGIIATVVFAITKFGETWDNVVHGVKTLLSGFKDFLEGDWSGGITKVFRGLGEVILSVAIGAVNIVFKTINWIADALNWIQEQLGVTIYQFGKLKLLSVDQFMGNKITHGLKGASFASGGFPEQGQLFIAREAGAEMVGNINGRTAVANNDQIVQAVSNGVFNAMSEALSGQGDRPIMVYLDGQKIYDNQKKIAQNKGYSLGMGVFG